MPNLEVKNKKKSKGKTVVTLGRDLTHKEKVNQIIKDKTDSSQLTDSEYKELVFLMAKERCLDVSKP
jgi:hypothetical protein